MLELISENIPAISGISVALLSFLGALIDFFKESRVERKDLRKAKDYIEIYSALPEGSVVKKNMEVILEIQIQKLAEKEIRKINVANIIAVIFVALLGGSLSYLIASWAIINKGILSWILWLIFAIIVFFTLGLSITGWSSRYNKTTSSKSK